MTRRVDQEFKIRFNEEEHKYYVYFNGPFGLCFDLIDSIEVTDLL